MSGHPVLPAEQITLPLLPLRDVVVFPHMVIPLFVGRPKSIKALEVAMEAGRQIMLVAQKAAGVVDPGDRGQDLGRDLLVQLDVLVELLRHRAAQRLDLGLGVGLGRHRRDVGDEVLAVVADAVRVGALDAFDQHLSLIHI